jgi:ATP-binding cassette subfamily B protein
MNPQIPPPAGTQTPPPARRASLRVLGRLAPFLAPYRLRLLGAGSALLVAAAATLSVPLAFRQLIDHGFSGESSVHGYFLALLALAVVLAAATALRFYSVSWLGERVTADLRRAVFGSVLRQDPVFFETLKSGEVLSRLSADTTLIQTLVGTSLSLGLRNSLLLLGALIMMLITSTTLALVIIGLLALVVLPIIAFGRRVRRLSRDSQDRVADASALAGETLGAIQVVQAFGREQFETDRFTNSANQAFGAAVRRIRARSALTALAIVLVFSAIVFVLWMGARSVIAGDMSAGQLAQFILYAAILGGATGAIAEVLGDIQRAAGATERLLELLESRPRIASPERAWGRPASDPRGASVQFEAVDFHYPSRPGQAALSAVSFIIAPGETVALVGASGAGKSTVFQLLLRFYDPQAGVIRINGLDVREWPLAELRGAIGLVAQDSVVFSADVRHNILYGRMQADESELLAAARAAHAHEFIEQLPQGYGTPLGERGVRLSGGQRQRLAIARALLRDPPLLLLDEATSALDSESERAVQAALDRAVGGRTTLIIAHRLDTVRRADRIMVFDQGRVVEIGSHEALSKAGGVYARLAALQFDARR